MKKLLGALVVTTALLAPLTHFNASAQVVIPSVGEVAAGAVILDKTLDAIIWMVDKYNEKTERQLEHQRNCKATTGDYSC